MATCPWNGCNYESDSEYGIKIHHKKKHGESLRGVRFKCDWCGETSRRKQHELDKHEGSFCSRSCYDAHREKQRGGKWVECEVCGEKIYKQPSHLDHASHGVHFCSYEHKGEYYQGENNPHWKGGGQSDFTRTPEGRRWRQAVLERDERTCQGCGAEPDVPHTHHIKPKGEYPELKTDVDNGVTLCEDCHAKQHPDKEALIRATSDSDDEGIAWAERKVEQMDEEAE